MTDLIDLMAPPKLNGQQADVLNHCRHDWLTQLESLHLYGIIRLAPRINELEGPRHGYRFERKWVTTNNGKRIMAYRLERS